MDEIPFGRQFESGVNNLTKTMAKRTIADLGNRLFKALSIGTELFFRRDMGERHFSSTSAGMGMGLWLFSGLLSCLTGTPLLWLLSLVGIEGAFLSIIGHIIPVIAATGVLWVYWRFSGENARRMLEFRNEAKTYHSKSRGQPRWEPAKERNIRVWGSVWLLLLAPVMGVAFIASMYVSANLAAQQQAALHDRYLDMLDAQIEGELLQDALLGKCPPEITFLYKPLPTTLKPELREDIAAAVVGKPVKIMAQMPRRNSATSSPIKAASVDLPPQAPPTTPEVSPPHAPAIATAVPPSQHSAPARPAAPSPIMARVACVPPSEARKDEDEIVETPGNESPKPMAPAASARPNKVFVAGLLLVIGVAGVVILDSQYPQLKFWPTFKSEPVQVVASVNAVPTPAIPTPPASSDKSLVNPRHESGPAAMTDSALTETNAATVAANPTPTVTNAPLAVTESKPAGTNPPPVETNSLATKPLAVETNSEPPQPVAPAAPSADTVEAQRQQEAEQKIAQMQAAITNQLAETEQFRTNSLQRIADNSQKIAGLRRSRRSALKKRNDNVQKIMLTVAQRQETDLHQCGKSLPLPSAPSSELDTTTQQISNISKNMTKVQQRIITELDSIDAAIAKESSSSTGGLLQFR